MAERSEHILVTGGSGFIGSHVCDALIAVGYTVRCMDNFATSDPENVEHLFSHDRFELFEGDIRSLADCEKGVSGIDRVIHLAALGSVPRSIAAPIPSHDTNLTGFLNVLESARTAKSGKRFVYASSSSVYGDSKELPKKEPNIGKPLSPYAVTKAGNEHYADLYYQLYGFPTVGLRFFNVFGERQDPEGPYAAAIPKFISSFLRHQEPTVHGDGHQSRDFTYVGNAVQAVLRAMESTDKRCEGEVFNVAYGSRVDLLELIGSLRNELAKIDPAISKVGIKHIEERPGDIRDSLADISKARDILGFAPEFDLQKGLERAVPWYVKNWGG